MPCAISWQPALHDDWRAGGFGVYVHWPFCAAKCPYCDFNSHVRSGVDQDRWREALCSEIRSTSEIVPGRVVDSIFFGGGTPSLMPPETVAGVIETIGRVWSLAENAEITLEANPTSVESGRFRGYQAAGVNRVSLGVQALNDADLRALGRMHSAAEALRALELARSIFDRVSFDLIYARQNQTLEGWRGELQQALRLDPDHLSLYQLTIEDGTRFGDLAARGRLRGMPDIDTSADLYLATQDICGEAGLPAYEVSNHARAGAESRHNLTCWRYGDYAGIGPGAHGRLSLKGTRWAARSQASPEKWIDAVEHGRVGATDRTAVSGSDQAAEMLMMGLRLSEGVNVDRYERLAGQPLDWRAVTELENLGLIVRASGRMRASPDGRMVLNNVLNTLLIQQVNY
jgi:putative oxygen-independent coproporphyrinogen III oxidase